MIPNIITIMSMCAGLSSIKMAMANRWDLAIVAILLSAFLDGMDGRVARLLGATSRFGEMMDSLSDLVTFGVAPSLVLYLCCVSKLGNPGWVAVLFFSVCMALRLARFNASLINPTATQPTWTEGFFVGIPAPAGALLSLTPIILHLHFGYDWLLFPKLVAINMILVGCLMVSRIPTIAIKNLHVSHKMIMPLMLLVVILLGAIYSEPWLTLGLIAMAYFLTLPFTFFKHRKLKKLSQSAPLTNLEID